MYNKETKNEKQVKFQRLSIGESRTFYPADISAYCFTGARYYETHEINGEPLFLEKLVEGEADLYYSKSLDAFFASSNEVALVELSVKPITVETGKKKETFDNYKKVLLKLFSSKQASIDRIDTVDLNTLSLTGIFSHYNRHQETPLFIYSRPKTSSGFFKSSITPTYSRVKLGITGGAYFNTIDISSFKYYTDYSYLIPEEPVSQLNPMFGAYFQYWIDRRFVDYTFNAEFLLNSFSFKSSSVNDRYVFDVYEYENIIQSTQLRVPLMFSIVVGNKKVKPTFGVGIFRGFSLGGEAITDVYRDNEYSGKSYEQRRIFQSLNQRGTILNLGLSYDINPYKTVQFSVRFENGRIQNKDFLMSIRGTYFNLALNL